MELEGMRDEVRVTAPVRLQLNSMGSFNVLDYTAKGDDDTITRTNLGIWCLAIVLQQPEFGASVLRKHCVKYPSRLNDPSVCVAEDGRHRQRRLEGMGSEMAVCGEVPEHVQHAADRRARLRCCRSGRALQDFISSGGVRIVQFRHVSATAVMTPQCVAGRVTGVARDMVLASRKTTQEGAAVGTAGTATTSLGTGIAPTWAMG